MKSLQLTLWVTLNGQAGFRDHIRHCPRCSTYRSCLAGELSLNEAYLDMVTAHLLAEAQAYGIAIGGDVTKQQLKLFP